MAENLRIYVAIFLVSAATLAFEITATRYYAVVQWHHLAYMVVSIALLGFGVSGTIISVVPTLLRQDLRKSLAGCSLLFSLTVLSGFILINRISLDPYEIMWDKKQVLHLILHYILLSVPYVFSGLVVGIPIAKKPERSGFFYASSMLGSAAGCLMPFLLLKHVSLQGVVYASILVGLASAIVLSYNIKRTIAYTSFFAFASYIILFYFNTSLNVSPYKDLERILRYPNSRVLYTRWGPEARVDAVETKGLRYAPGLSIVFNGSLPRQVGFTVDAGNLMALVDPHGDLSFITYLPSSLPYHLLKKPNVLALSGGVGVDLISAVYYNSSSVTVLEENRVLSDLITSKFAGFYDVIQREDVSLVHEDDRNFLKKEESKYDIIILPLNVGQLASTSGVYSQTESYTYTVEAFREYIRHLSDEGVLATTRWVEYPPRESIRLVVLAAKALESEGVENPEKHIAVICGLTTYTLLLSKKELSQRQLSVIREYASSRKFDLVYLPGMNASEANRFNRFPRPVYYESVQSVLDPLGRSAFIREYMFDVSAPSDDKPFFFNQFRFRKAKPLYESMGEKWEPFFEGGFIAVVVLLQALVFSVLFIAAPLMLTFRGRGGRLQKWLPTLTYFFLIGLGFMFVEITLIQKFILPLGKPVYAVATVLGSLLFFAGAGSLASEGIKEEVKAKTTLSCVALTVFFYVLILPNVFHVILGRPLIQRAIYSIAFLAPLAFLMGFPFPLGVRVSTKTQGKDILSWAWAVNGAASVFGAVLAVVFSTTLGYNITLLLAGVFYAVASSLTTRHSSSPPLP